VQRLQGNSEGEIAAIAAAVGGTVDAVRVDETSAGPRVIAKLTVPSSWASFLMLRQLSIEDAGDPIVRDFALDLRKKAGANEIRFARALQLWVQTHVAFVREQHETFQDSAYTLRTLAGDCDDHARLMFAAIVAAGYHGRIMPLFKGARNVAHAVTQIEIPGQGWKYVETTVRAHFAEHPLAAAKRLGLSVRKDILATDTVVGA